MTSICFWARPSNSATPAGSPDRRPIPPPMPRKIFVRVPRRVGGSSRFGAGPRYGFFPSAAFAWRASEEPFVKQLGLFDDLKVRASNGRTGNQEIEIGRAHV